MFGRKSFIAIGRILLLLAPWVFIAYLFRDVDAVLDAFEDASLAPMAGGLLLTVAGLLATAWLWTRLVGHLSRDVAVPDTPHLLRAFARSWLARYLPGKVWSYGARMVHTDVEVAPRRIVAGTLVDEFALIVGSASTLGLGLWAWAAAGPAVGVPVLVVGLLALMAAVSRLDQLTRWALRFLAGAIPERWRTAAEEMERAADDPGLGLKASALFTGGYLLTNFLFGLAFVLIVLSLSDIAMEDLPLLIGGYSLAAVLGIVAFFAPAGLGVREGVLAGFLTSVVASPVAASLAILARLVVVVADVLLLALVELASMVSQQTPVTSRGTEHEPGAVDTPATRARR
jgi:uncharacterized membrane protein YbhN (UPF0104 family)